MSACDNGTSPSGKDPGETSVSVTGVTLDQRSITLLEGGTSTLKATVVPGNAANKNVTWSSSDVKKATVSGGVVKAVAAGTAIITVTTVDGGKTDTCTVTVLALAKIKVTKSPDIVAVGEPLNIEEIEVEATWGDDSTDKYIKESVEIAPANISGFDKDKPGNQTVTVTYEGKTDTFDVLVLGVTGITVETGPSKTLYKIGEELDIAGMVVKAAFSDGEEREVEHSALHISGFDSSAAGEKTVTVTYGDETATFTVTVLALTKIVITSQPTKTRYVIGESLNIAGLEVKATWGDDGTDKYITERVEITPANISGFNSSAAVALQVVTVTYGGKTAAFTVTVFELSKIEINTYPTKTMYAVGGLFDIAGLVVTATYSDNETEIVAITSLTVTGFNSATAGEKTVTVTYGGKTATFTVTVFEISKIEITTAKTRYAVGEPLNTDGFAVTVTYGPDLTETIAITSVTVTGFSSAAAGEKTVTVTYGGKTATFTITVFASVTFYLGGGAWGSDTADRTVEMVTSGDKPADPSRKFHTFNGWYTLATDGVLFDFNAPITGSNIPLYARWTILPFTIVADVSEYLATQTGTVGNPVYLPMKVIMGNMYDTNAGNWQYLLTVLGTAGDYVALDLSACPSSETIAPAIGTSFTTGKNRIVSVTLPDTARTIQSIGSSSDGAAFRYFTALKTISGTGVTSVGDYAFYGCASLASVSLPVVETIGDWAFNGCASLSSVSLLSAVETIGGSAFRGCTSLVSVSLPVAKTIPGYVFYGCTSLESVSLPVAETIGDGAFNGCIALESVSLPVAASVGNTVFRGCTSLESASLPLATSIGFTFFYGCISLASVEIPSATSLGSPLGSRVFQASGTQALSIRMGPAAPSVEMYTFGDSSEAKNVTVIVPSGATGYGASPVNTTADNWGNAFRGKGWDGTDYLTGTVNSDINLTIQYMTE